MPIETNNEVKLFGFVTFIQSAMCGRFLQNMRTSPSFSPKLESNCHKNMNNVGVLQSIKTAKKVSL